MSFQQIKINPKFVTIVLKPKSTAIYTSILPNLYTWLQRRKITVQFIAEEQKRITQIFKQLPKGLAFISEENIQSASDLIITLGGDGTLLGVARKSTNKSPPVMGVNMGKLGFITEFSRAELYDQLEHLLKHKVSIQKVNLFKTTVIRDGKNVYQNHFLNDAVITKNEISRMFSLTVESHGEHIYDISGDGLIVSSPIGSTAYSLAAGGPIIHPQVNSVVLTPICPHSLTHRPLITPDKFELKIRIPPRMANINLTLDGQEYFNVKARDCIQIKKSTNRYLKLIDNPARTYFQTLKEKFTHGRREI